MLSYPVARSDPHRGPTMPPTGAVSKDDLISSLGDECRYTTNTQRRDTTTVTARCSSRNGRHATRFLVELVHRLQHVLSVRSVRSTERTRK